MAKDVTSTCMVEKTTNSFLAIKIFAVYTNMLKLFCNLFFFLTPSRDQLRKMQPQNFVENRNQNLAILVQRSANWATKAVDESQGRRYWGGVGVTLPPPKFLKTGKIRAN